MAENVFNFKVVVDGVIPTDDPLVIQVKQLLCSLGTVDRWTMQEQDQGNGDEVPTMKGCVLFNKLAQKKSAILNGASFLRGARVSFTKPHKPTKRFQWVLANGTTLRPQKDVDAENVVDVQDPRPGQSKQVMPDVDELRNIFDEDTVPIVNPPAAPASALHEFRGALAVAEQEGVRLVHLPPNPNPIAEPHAIVAEPKAVEHRKPQESNRSPVLYRGARLGFLPYISQPRLPEWAAKTTPTLIKIVDHFFLNKAKQYLMEWDYGRGIRRKTWAPAGTVYRSHRGEVLRYNQELRS